MEQNPNPSFYKIMFPLPRMSEQMSIPPDFHKHIDKRAFKKATFRDCSGCTWPVKLYKNERGVFVKDGWNRFFHAHSLGDFEFLTFTYDGETCFDVIIFSKNGANKLEHHDTSNGSNSFEHRSEDENEREGDEVYDAVTSVEVVPDNGRRKRGRPRKNPQPNSQTPLSPHEKGQDVAHRQSSKLKQLGLTKSSKNKMKVEITETSDDKIAFGLKDVENEKIYLSQSLLCDEPDYRKNPKETEGLENEIKDERIDLYDDEPGFRSMKFNQTEARNEHCAKKVAFSSRFPFFEKCIDLEDINKRYQINLPRVFAKKYLPKTTMKMELIDELGTSWEVTFSSVGTRFYGGWVHFMRDNELKCGDRCIFELVKEKEMKVYIYRS